MVEENELLFFDTFSHETGEQLNLDLVQFPRPVYIHEIRIIPLGARVQADFPGGHRLGATNPSSFQLEFFVNDLSKRGACTFERMGGLEYKQNVDIQFIVTNEIPTDGLVIRGWYSTVTLAIYGVLTKITKDRSSPPPPPPQSSRAAIESHSPEFEHTTPEPSEIISNNWERPVRGENASEQVPATPTIPINNSSHPHHNTDPRRFNESNSTMPHSEPRRQNYSEHSERHHQSTSSPTNANIPQNSRYTYNKNWSAAQDDVYRKKPDFDHQDYETGDVGFGSRSRSPSQPPWDKHENREPGDAPTRDDAFRREKDNSQDFTEDRRLLPKDKRREHDRVERFPGREDEWNKEGRVKDDRVKREIVLTPRDARLKLNERKELAKRPPSPLSPSKQTHPKTPPHELKIGGTIDMENNLSDENVHPGTDELFEQISPDQSPPEDYISEHDLHENLEHMEDDGYEEILSEEEDMSDGDDRNIDLEIEYDIGDEAWNFTSSFNPFQCEFSDFLYFKNPGMSTFEQNRECSKTDEQGLELSEDSQKLLQILKQFSDKEKNEKWVEAVENISLLIESGLSVIHDEETYKFAVTGCLDWVNEGLNYECAIVQAQTPYKVRHLKAGIKLATNLFQTDDLIVENMIAQNSIKQLLDLYSKPYMTLPVKLLIIRALDAATFTCKGLNYFLNEKLYFDLSHESFKLDMDIEPNDPKQKVKMLTGYQRLWDILLTKEPSRVIVTIKSLINKLHVYEVLVELKDSVEKISRVIDFRETTPTKSDTEGDTNIQDVLENLEVTSHSTEELANKVVSCFSEITDSYIKANKKIAQFVRYLPAVRQFETPKPIFDPYPCLFRMFKDCQLLEIIFVLSSNPLTSIHPTITSAIKDLLVQFLAKNSGLKFFLNNPRVTNGLHRALFQSADESREENGEESIANQVGMNLVCTLQALQHIDSLFAYHQSVKNDKKDMDDPETVASLHNMYSMTFGAIGKMAVINVLAMEYNLDSLLPFVELKNSEEIDSKLAKSVCCGYATELIILTVHHSDSVDLLQNFGDRIIQLSNQSKLNELSRWMCPLKKPISYNYDAISYLVVNYVKKYARESATLPPELITALRILENIIIPPTGLQEDEKEMKFKYAVLQLFANDALEGFVTILQQICDSFLKPTTQAFTLVGQQGAFVLSIVKPVAVILRTMLSYLIKSRGAEFQDLTAVPVLLKLHTLLCLFPMSSYMYSVAQQVQNEIIETLLAYTQPILSSAESEEALSKSLWTKMVSEVLKYTVVGPNTWMTGLTILSELLPLPLPLQTKECFTAEEVARSVNSRKVWSAHLHSLGNLIEFIITSMAATSCQPLQQLLRRICVQLSDLAAPTAMVIVRSVLDILNESVPGIIPPLVSENVKDEKLPVPPVVPPTTPAPVIFEGKPCSSTTSRILDFMSYMVSNATFKITMLHILGGNLKSADDNFKDVMLKLTTLLNLPSSKASHQQGQECIVSIFQSLSDPDIGLITIENGAAVKDVMASSLPNKETLSQIVTALVLHIGTNQHPFASVLPSLRTLVMITEHDLGYIYIKTALESNPTVLRALLHRLCSSFSKVSSDCLSTLSTVLELLRLMVQGYEEPTSIQTPGVPVVSPRTLTLSAFELVPILLWTKPDNTAAKPNSEPTKEKSEELVKEETASVDESHPLLQLEKQLTEVSADEDVLESLLESLQTIINILNDIANKEKIAKVSEGQEQLPLLPPPETLTSQFASRAVFVVGEVDEERLSPAYWLGLPAVEDADQDMEQIQMDLVTLTEKYCSDFDVKNELEKLCSVEDTTNTTEVDKKDTGKRRYPTSLGTTNIEAPMKKPFIAPMRGRAFSRGTIHSGGRANDPFRSRPPNTSRPPSMHVDDFLAMEYQAPTGSSTVNIPKRTVKEVQRGRGRGFDPTRGFGSTRGARFFSPPSGAYGRRETNRSSVPFLFETSSTPRPTARPAVTAWTGRSAPIPLPKSLHSFARGAHAERGPSQRPRDPYSLSITSGSSRFGRSTRSMVVEGGGVGGSPNVGVIEGPGHWPESRMKIPDSRFLPPTGAMRGRRDLSGRHLRSFTR